MDGHRVKATEQSPPPVIARIGFGEGETPSERFEEIDERRHWQIEHE
jgi:hypothetical protein